MKSKIKPSLLFILSTLFFITSCASDVNAENMREITGPVFRENKFGDRYIGWATSLNPNYFDNHQGFPDWEWLDYESTVLGADGKYNKDEFVGLTINKYSKR